MLRKYNVPDRLFVFLLAFVLLSACKEEENGDQRTGIILDGFGPSNQKHGEDIRFIGTGLGQVTAIVMPGDIEIPGSDFKTHTDNLIVITVPVETTEGKVILKTPVGNIESKTAFGLDYVMSITSLPEEVKPGTNITIQGEFLKYVKEVTFDIDKIVTEFVSLSRTELVVTVPLDAQTGKVWISDGKEEPQIVESPKAVTITLPEVIELTPANLTHGSDLTLIGTDLDLINKITFPGGSEITNFVSQTETELVVTVPNDALKGKLTMEVPSGITIETEDEVIIILPKATMLTPDPGGPGVDITITGTDLELVDKITFPGVIDPVAFKSRTTTQIVVTAPDNANANGVIFFITIHGFKTPAGVQYKVPSADPTPLLVIYSDVLHSDWQKWGGWETSEQDLASIEQPKNGTNSIKISYSTAYGGFQLHPVSPDPFDMSAYTSIKLSVYGGAGVTAGTKIALYIKNNAGVESTKMELVLDAPGEYKTFEVLLSALGNPSDIEELNIQNSGTANITVYLDDIGLF